MSILDRDYFRDEETAFSKLESVLWPEGPVCSKCGVINDAHRIAANPGKKVRYGLYRCNACKAQFTVTVGTVFESSHIPVHKWLQASYLLCSSKKGISAKQIERTLQVTYKTAWFMMHRLREAMRDGILAPLGGAGEIVEADETYFGRREKPHALKTSGRPMSKGWGEKRSVIALVQRGGSVRSFHVDRADKRTVASIVTKNVKRESRLHTDQSKLYSGADAHVAEHETVNHTRKEYARGDVTTNSMEGYFSIFKRGMKGVYQHCNEKHLQRYLAEFDFRYNEREALGVNDATRTDRALLGAKGKRLTYGQTNRH